MLSAKIGAKLRRCTRQCVKYAQKMFPHHAEFETFGPVVQFRDRRYLGHCSGDVALDAVSRDRAAALLAAHLNGLQRSCLRRQGFFIVTGRSGRRFRIWARRQLPVELCNSQGASNRHKPKLYCVFSYRSDDDAVLPLGDCLLELKLCLESNEEYFLSVSNPNFKEGLDEKAELMRKSCRIDLPLPKTSRTYDPLLLNRLAG